MRFFAKIRFFAENFSKKKKRPEIFMDFIGYKIIEDFLLFYKKVNSPRDKTYEKRKKNNTKFEGKTFVHFLKLFNLF
jgi:hypothetical protein